MFHLTIDARIIKKETSGLGKYLINILQRLIPRNCNWEISLLGDEKEISRYEFYHYDNVRVIECLAPIYSIREQFELLLKIPLNSNLFWTPHYNIPILYNGKILTTVHDVQHLTQLSLKENFFKKIYAEIMFSCVAKKSRKIICISNFSFIELQKRKNVKKEKVRIIYNGVDLRWFHIKKGKRVYYKPYFLYVGNIKPHKNLKRLLYAFEKILNDIPHDLVLVGKKNGFITEDKDVFEIAERMGNRVIFTGYLEDQLLQQYFAYADAFIFPSLYEGFGLPPLEAMASECPVIASNSSAIPEVCGENAIYFNCYNEKDIAEKILWVARNKDKCKKMVEKGKIHAQKFSWDKCVIEVEKIIKKFEGKGNG